MTDWRHEWRKCHCGETFRPKREAQRKSHARHGASYRLLGRPHIRAAGFHQNSGPARIGFGGPLRTGPFLARGRSVTWDLGTLILQETGE
jgi:hypothetical protein